jgi:hypothetical protein
MAKKKEVITSEDVLRETPSTSLEVQKSWEKAFKAFADSPKVEVLIPDAYRASFGDPLHFSVNGISILIPIGEKVKVPKPFADHAQRLMKGAVISKNQKRLTPEELYKD